jgi:hypothetical protein
VRLCVLQWCQVTPLHQCLQQHQHEVRETLPKAQATRRQQWFICVVNVTLFVHLLLYTCQAAPTRRPTRRPTKGIHIIMLNIRIIFLCKTAKPSTLLCHTAKPFRIKCYSTDALHLIVLHQCILFNYSSSGC